MSEYELIQSTPSTETYRHLRQATGLSPMSAEAAERGLPNTLFAVQVLFRGEPVGMGRVIGDGGTFFQVVDIAILPEHQGHGLGKSIIAAIADYIDREVPESGFVSLLADGEAHHLYRKYGFTFTGPACVGMKLIKSTRL
ncbi:GNAT family N-acetyltransferase [Wenzhouxiangella sp. AB-CW3]|uniref:GNAT family N-acetyltransferase n=1 Tax=Wenzhouxiangella sp. AB-CW3 TaxID=2771012 RepID=UPI00168A7D7E|nr:GNAT family N-acetyltransferase [Wenzhouxiangella sp. AB-CW3]QOC24056.1 GNAT family N-acetyltransferase [Wenzhouxiangella sp. AB-CW3]